MLNPEKYGYKMCDHRSGYGSSLKEESEQKMWNLNITDNKYQYPDSALEVAGNGVRRKSSPAHTKSSNESTLEQIMGFIQENNPAGVVGFKWKTSRIRKIQI